MDNMKQKNGLFNLGPNWPIVLVAFYGCCIHSGCLIYAFSLFINPLQETFGWDSATIMLAFTLQFICIGLASPFVGKAVAQFGTRRVIVVGALTAVIGFMLLPLIKTPFHFYLFSILIGVGSAAMGPVPCSVAVTRAFTEKRGLAIGIMSTGIGVGGFVLSPLIGGVFLPYLGWKGAYICIAVVTAVMIPLALVFMKRKTSATNAAVPQDHNPAATMARPNAKEDLFSVSFVAIAAGFFLFLFCLVGVLQSQVPHLRDIGFPLLTASSALGALGLVSAVAKFIFGVLCDRHHPRFVFIIAASFSIAGIFLLLNITPDSSPLWIWAYALIFGIGAGSWLPMMSMIVSTTFGVATYSIVFGAVSMIQQTGSATGPLISGYIYDKTGSYHAAFIMAIVLLACSIGVILLSGYRVKKSLPMAS